MKRSNFLTVATIFPILLGLGASRTARAADAKAGESLFQSRACIGCHAIGKIGAATTGPNLQGAVRKLGEAWTTRWLSNPDSMRTDPEIVKLKSQFNNTDMPNLGLNPDEVKSLVLYLKDK